VGEQGVSSDEDSSPELSWSGDVASAAVNWSNMSGSSSSSPPHGAEVSSSRRPRETGRDKTVGSSSRLTAPPTRVGQQLVRSPAAPSGTGTPGPQRPAPCQADPPRRSEEQSVYVRQLYDSSDRPDFDSLQRRRSRGMSSDLASTPSMPSAVEPSAAPWRLQSFLIRGGGAPDVLMSHVADGGHGPTLAVTEVGWTAPEPMGGVLPLYRRPTEAEKRPRRRAQDVPFPSRARSAPPPSRACRTAR
jgi:hypothetical protein